MRWLVKFGNALEWVGNWIIGLTLMGLLAIITLQFIDRHFIDVPIAAPDAYARILLIWLTFMGFALAGRAGLAIRVDLLDHWLSARTRALLGMAFDFIKLSVLVLLIVKGWVLVQIGFYQSILGTDLTTAVPNAGLWVSALMMFVFVAIALIEVVTGKSPQPSPEAKAELRVE